MKILIYGINFSPELTGIGKYTGEMAAWLASRGHEVQVITAPPYYPQWRIAANYSAWKYRAERIHNIPVVRCPLWVPNRLTTFHRIAHLTSFALSSAPVILWKAFFWRPQIVFVLQPAFLCTPAAWMASRLSGAALWMHVQDFELDAALELGLLKGKTLRKILLSFERFWMRRLDHVSTISEHMLEHLTRKGAPSKSRVMLRNWVDTKQIFPIKGENPFRQQLGLSANDFVALYSGNMGRKQGLEILIETAYHLRKKPNCHVVLAGDGSMRRTLEKAAQASPNIHFLPLQPTERLNDLLNLADIHLLLQRPMTSGFLMPSKLTGMLASGRPVVVTAYPGCELADAIHGCGLLVPPDNPQALADAILTLCDDSVSCQEMGNRGRQIAFSLWDKQVILEQFEHNLLGVSAKALKESRPHVTLRS